MTSYKSLLIISLLSIGNVLTQTTTNSNNIYNPLGSSSSTTAVGQAIHNEYSSSSRVYSVHNTVPNMGGPNNYSQQQQNQYIKSRAYLAIPVC